ncbi:MAG TPA: tetraacyldisaccharide 4'-kinase [Synergistaceae bacterium]|nr:tetraacyldisaccharide 4'-kinase [Synergistaceae bacterium]
MGVLLASYFRHIRGEEEGFPWVFLSPLGWLAGACSRARNFSYDHGLSISREMPVPVVSVGNITHGGTNKTPFVEMLARMFIDAGLRPGIVMRGYGRKEKDCLLVQKCEPSRDLLGDEALLLSGRLGGVPIAVSADRAGGVLLLAGEGVDLAIADDGFQHRKMGRDVDVVLIDATCPFGNGRLMPAGMLRESPRSLIRAHMVVITKADQVPPDRVRKIAATIQKISGRSPFLSSLALAGWSSFLGPREGLRDSGTPELPAAAFSAIGNPASFGSFLEKLGFPPLFHEAFRDHHIFSEGELDAICGRAVSSGARSLICTEKDIFNLPQGWSPPLPVFVPRVRTLLRDERSFVSTLSRHLQPKVVVSSNGHGEDAIGSLLAERLKQKFPLSEVSGFPIVGRGQEYRSRGISVLSPPSETPSGGVIKYRLRDLARDIRSGLLRHIGAQTEAWSGLRGKVRTVICVGDVYLFLHTLWGQGAMPVLLATAKSVRLHGHWGLEKHLLRLRCRRVFTRDPETARELSERKADAVYMGNPIMDLAGDTINRSEGKRPFRVLLLPGSRERAYEDLGLLLDAAEIIAREEDCRFEIVVASALERERLLGKAPSWMSVNGDLVKHDKGGPEVRLFFGEVSEAASRSDILVGLGGTANQICAGMGVPVVSIDEKGKRVQKKLLGEAESLVPADPVLLAREALAILRDPVLRESMSRAGRERMGGGGAVDALVEYASEVLGWSKRQDVFRTFSDFAEAKGDPAN